jgi:spore germination cell wall hydrolase CwlJ-like protein
LVLVALLLVGLSSTIWHFRRSLWPQSYRVHHLSMDEARAVNAAMPFADGPVKPARRYVFHGTMAAREQAIDCLATAALYEAGDDDRGQRAVIQVILNRVRSRAFPKTVCGVVYQGAARRTGCQFSFTCDGSLWRRTERKGWPAARRRATQALNGTVVREIGDATHYHTDWVVPPWARSLDKIGEINSHIFYRPARVRRSGD